MNARHTSRWKEETIPFIYIELHTHTRARVFGWVVGEGLGCR